MREACEKAGDAVRLIISEGVAKAQNMYNG